MDYLEERVKIALVFFTLWVNSPGQTTGPEVSNRLFDSKQECAEFVNTIAQGDVVDENYEFKFASMDGLMFVGGCYTPEEFKEKFYVLDGIVS
jgi:hypothetical protein